MDNQYRSRGQNEAPMRPTSNPRYQQPGREASQQHRHSQQTGSSSSDRQRAASGYGGYYQEPAGGAFSGGAGVPQSTMGYSQSAADYGQDTRQTQGFANTYSPGMMYNVQQAGGPNSVFDTGQSFPPRQHTGMQMISADVAGAPYFSSDPATAAAIQAQAASSSASSAGYHQQTPNPSDTRSGVVTGYPSNIGVLGGTAGLPPHTTSSSAPDPPTSAASVAEVRDYADTDESYASYQRTLKEVFRNIRSGALATAADSLLNISDWLLSRVESLGLTVDDEDLYDGRVKLWKNFNNAWLGLLEKQKEFMWKDKQLQRSQSVVPFENLQKMARELVRLCDGVERFGLVDYDYGVWEERIMAILTECIDLYGLEEDAAATGGSSTSRQG